MDSERLGIRQLLDNEEAARVLGCTPGTLRVWVSRRRIPFVRIGRLVRFDPDALENFIQENSVEPQP